MKSNLTANIAIDLFASSHYFLILLGELKTV